MTPALLDVNVLIALMWPAHESHEAAQKWFSANSHHGWATCPFTQVAFVRIVSNPAFSPDAVAPSVALELLTANLQTPHHQFWPDEIDLRAAANKFTKKLIGHDQVTDAYLLGLTMHNRGRLVTTDRGMNALVEPKLREAGLIVTI